MDTLISFVGDGYVLSASDETTAYSILILKDDQDKILHLDSHKTLAAAGPNGDVTSFTEYIQRNVALYELTSGVKLNTKAVANFTRKELSEHLRKAPYQCNLIMGGYDEPTEEEKEEVGRERFGGNGASCYYMDYLGTLVQVPYIADGFAQSFVLATFDKYWRKGMRFEEGLELMGRCIRTVQERLIVKQSHFVVKVCDKDGVRRLRGEELEKVGVQTQLDRMLQWKGNEKKGKEGVEGKKDAAVETAA